jgi:AcrR family transcriptional regulator
LPDRLPQLLRSDARDNRDRVLVAARELFSEQGLGATMREVARRAGVGPATLYRRFPTKPALVEAAFTDQLRLCRSIVEKGHADPDPWIGFCSVIEQITELNGRNQGFVEAFMSAHPEPDTFTVHREKLLRMLSDLAERAKVGGGLRDDFVINDLVLVLLAARGLASIPSPGREVAARRFAALAIDSFRKSSGNSHLPPSARLPLLIGEMAGVTARG